MPPVTLPNLGRPAIAPVVPGTPRPLPMPGGPIGVPNQLPGSAPMAPPQLPPAAQATLPAQAGGMPALQRPPMAPQLPAMARPAMPPQARYNPTPGIARTPGLVGQPSSAMARARSRIGGGYGAGG